MKKVLGLLAGLAIALGLSSCGDDVTKWNTIEDEYQLPVITLKIGDTVQETEWNNAAKKNICKVDITEKQVVNLSVKASKIVKEEEKDITEEIKDSLKWYVGQTQVDEEKNGLTTFDFDTANKNRGSYTFYCSYTAKDANGTEWTYTSRAVEFKLLKPGINLEVSDDELEFGAKNNTADVKTTLKVTPYEFEPTSYQVVQIYGNDEDIDVTNKDLENDGVELTFNKDGKYRIKVIASDGTKTATEEIEVHVKKITVVDTDVEASFTVDKTEVYEGTSMPVVTPAAIKTITYSDGDEKKDNITVTKFELKVGDAEPQLINAATGTVGLTEAGDLSISVTKIWAKDGEAGEEKEYVCQSDAKTITYIKSVGEATYSATATVSAATVKETVDTTFKITSKLEKSQKYTNSETPVTVDISNQISGIVVKLGETVLTANEDKSYNVSGLASGENTLSITVNGEGSTSATSTATITYAAIDKAATEYVATITKTSALKGDVVDLSKIYNLERKLHWTNNDVKTENVTPTKAVWKNGETEITEIDTSAKTTFNLTVTLTYDGVDTTSEVTPFEITTEPSVVAGEYGFTTSDLGSKNSDGTTKDVAAGLSVSCACDSKGANMKDSSKGGITFNIDSKMKLTFTYETQKQISIFKIVSGAEEKTATKTGSLSDVTLESGKYIIRGAEGSSAKIQKIKFEAVAE